MNKSESNEANAMAGNREGQLAALTQNLIRSVESEKAALARMLHTELGALLTVAALDVSVVAHKLKQTEPELAARLQRVLGKIKEAAAFKRDAVEGLRPSMLDSLGLSICLSEHVLEFGKRTGLQVISDIRSDADGMDADGAIAVFRIAQEALDNVVRHARASGVRIALQEKDRGATLLIEDDGIGVPPGAVAATVSLGLIGMRERAALLGGRLAVRRGEQGGTTVEAWFPLPR